ncbi:MAG: hypothetical protein HQL89_14385 [Magnetococcales bacterium]|nr:hypothetical protein [Magnetococcales bacterium]
MQVQFNPFSGELFPATAVGTAGANCLSLLHGPDTPGAGIGADGDYYLNTTNSDLYTKAAGTWSSPIANFKGTPGAAGATLRHGSALPQPVIGADGDYYLHTSTNNLYTKVAGVWGEPIANFNGIPGAAGATLRHGSALPQPVIGADGDYYLHTSTNNLYTKVAGVWGEPIANFNGTPGAPGATLRHGSALPQPVIGADGDYYLHTSTNNLYTKVAGVWGEPIANFNGTPGAAGATLRHGSGIPVDGLGSDGDYYLNTTNSDLYTKAAGAWGSPIANFQGIQGGPGQAIFHRDEWNSATAYIPGDGVTHGGSSYFCKAGHSNQEPPNTTYWGLLAAKGDPGAGVMSGMTPGGLLIGASDGSATQDAQNFFCDIPNRRLGIGTGSPPNVLSVRNSGAVPSEEVTQDATSLVSGDQVYDMVLSKMIDGNTDGVSNEGIIYATSAPDKYVGLGFAMPRSFTEFRFFTRAQYDFPKHFIVERYNDGVWIKVPITGWVLGANQYNGDEGEANNSLGWKIVTFSAVTDTKIRVRFLSVWTGGPGGHISISELKVYAALSGVSTDLLDVRSDGRVGLNAAMPSAFLDVNNPGDILSLRAFRAGSTSTDYIASFHSNHTSPGLIQAAIRVDGSLASRNNSIVQPSDPKIKEGIVDAPTDIFDRFMKIRFVNFNYIGETLRQLGVLSTELKTLFPGLVESIPDHKEIPDPDWTPGPQQTEADRPWKSVFQGTYTEAVKMSIIPLLASVSLQIEIRKREALEDKVAVLRTRMVALEARVTALEAGQ